MSPSIFRISFSISANSPLFLNPDIFRSGVFVTSQRESETDSAL